MNRQNLPIAVLAIAMSVFAASACGVSATADAGAAEVTASPTISVAAAKTSTERTTTTTEPAATTTSTAKPAKDFVCPVTIPPEPGLVAPPPYPADYPDESFVWFGTEDLWTALALDGRHGPRKGVWWSANFPGGAEEERPDLDVTWTRLDGTERIVDIHGDATNAYTTEEHWFMMAGIDPDEPGCWHVEASYKDATLSYVYELG